MKSIGAINNIQIFLYTFEILLNWLRPNIFTHFVNHFIVFDWSKTPMELNTSDLIYFNPQQLTKFYQPNRVSQIEIKAFSYNDWGDAGGIYMPYII